MRKPHWVMAVLGLVLVLLSLWQTAAAKGGLEITRLPATELPLTLVAPARVSLAERPLVLIGHGFAGSSAIMRGFALTLAHAGYPTVVWDFASHGSNPQPLSSVAAAPHGGSWPFALGGALFVSWLLLAVFPLS